MFIDIFICPLDFTDLSVMVEDPNGMRRKGWIYHQHEDDVWKGRKSRNYKGVLLDLHGFGY
jgi:hypothetical protein